MTITTTASRKIHSGNGVTTVFAYDFKIIDQTHIKVYLDVAGVFTLQTLTTNYSVSGVGAPGGGNITFVTPPSSGTGNVVFVRDVPSTQTSDYLDGDRFPADTLETNLDRLTMLIQELEDQIARSFLLPLNTSGVSNALPSAVAGKAWKWNSSGTAVEFSDFLGSSAAVSPFMAPVVGSVNADVLMNFAQAHLSFLAGGRLTLSATNPTAHGVSGNTLYYLPFEHNWIDLWDGTRWLRKSFTNPSVAIPAVANKIYDVYAYLSGGNVALELLAWTSDTARATTLSRQDGTWCKTGDKTRRYLGAIGTDRGTTVVRVGDGQGSGPAGEGVWNMYNRVPSASTNLVSGPQDTVASSSNVTLTGSDLTIVNGDPAGNDIYLNVSAGIFVVNSSATSRNVNMFPYDITGAGVEALGGPSVYELFAVNNVQRNIHYSRAARLLAGRRAIVMRIAGDGVDTQTWRSGHMHFFGNF